VLATSFFRRIPPKSDPTSYWNAHCRLVGVFTRMMVHLPWHVSTRVALGARKPPSLCLQCRRLACANPRSILLAAFSRLLSRCYLYSFRPPVLSLLCANETSSAHPTRGRWSGEQHAHGLRNKVV
jgi:hypothetical protein